MFFGSGLADISKCFVFFFWWGVGTFMLLPVAECCYILHSSERRNKEHGFCPNKRGNVSLLNHWGDKGQYSKLRLSIRIMDTIASALKRSPLTIKSGQMFAADAA
jgi:hypothetical protein